MWAVQTGEVTSATDSGREGWGAGWGTCSSSRPGPSPASEASRHWTLRLKACERAVGERGWWRVCIEGGAGACESGAEAVRRE